jgi:putative colanic acid biosynthesis acetyltransferase WcaF
MLTVGPTFEAVSARSVGGWRLHDFKGHGYDKGRSRFVQAVWFAVANLAFMKWWFPRCLRPWVLRIFGADIGLHVFIRHRVRILWPWKLRIGNDCWIGEDVWLLNLEPIIIGHDVCLSQGAFICTGSHDHRSPSFEYDNGPIEIGDQVWIAAQVLVLRGVRLSRGTLVGARAIVTRDTSEGAVVRTGSRW